MKLRKLRNVFGLAALGWIFGTGTVFAQTVVTWQGNNGDAPRAWAESTNWARTGLSSPPTAGEIALFDNTGVTREITVGGTRSAGMLRFSGVSGTRYAIGVAPSGSSAETPQQTINLSGLASLVEVTSGLGATVNARLGVLGNDVSRTISNAGSSELTLAGGISFQGTGNHTLSVGGTSAVRIGSLSTAGSSTLVVNKTSASGVSLLIDGGVSGNVTVAGGASITGTTTLTGNMTVSGSVANLTVNSGAAQINASGSVNNLTLNAGSAQINALGNVSNLTVNNTGSAVVNGTAGIVNVNSGGVLSGTGTITTATIASGGQHRPGTSPGLQSFTTLTYNSGSTFVWELEGTGSVRGTDFDAINAGTVNIASGIDGATSRLSISSALLNNSAFWDQNRSWQVFNTNATINGNFKIDTSLVSALSTRGTFSWSGGTLNFASVPEPGTLALLGVVSTVGFGVARFRRRKNKAAV